ncbi:hypothetical protein PM082_019949 [Marasmius tenuissimus]|nr:hypothetical protein PM082_019949 [Marasmius tenuissimus]
MIDDQWPGAYVTASNSLFEVSPLFLSSPPSSHAPASAHYLYLDSRSPSLNTRETRCKELEKARCSEVGVGLVSLIALSLAIQILKIANVDEGKFVPQVPFLPARNFHSCKQTRIGSDRQTELWVVSRWNQ